MFCGGDNTHSAYKIKRGQSVCVAHRFFCTQFVAMHCTLDSPRHASFACMMALFLVLMMLTSVGMGSPVAVAVPEGWHPRGNARFAPHPTPGLL